MKRHFLAAFLLVLLCLAAASAPSTAGAGSKSLEASPNGQRFLFIVDMSSSMEDLQSATEASLYDLLRGGVGGYMKAGDTYGVWTFNSETTTGRFPMQIWDPRRAGQLGTIAAAYISGLTYEKSSNVKETIRMVQSVVHSVSNLVVFLISDGRPALQGTPVDKTVNAEYKKKSRDRKRVERPFITTLIGRDGWIVGGSVSIAGEPILMPTRLDLATPTQPVSATATPPPRPTTSRAAAAAPVAPINPAPAISSAASVATAPPVPPVASAGSAVPSGALPPLVPPAALVEATPVEPTSSPPRRVTQIITRSNVTAAPKPEPAGGVAAATLPEPGTVIARPALPETNLASVHAALSSPPPGGPAAKVETRDEVPGEGLGAGPGPAPIAASVAKVTTGSHGAAAEKGFVTLSPDPLPVAARELDPSEDVVRPAPGREMQAVSIPLQTALGGTLMLVFGALLLAATLLLFILLFRRFRPVAHGSLITQSMDRR